MTLLSFYSIKRFLRICDCLLTPKKETIRFRNDLYPFFCTYWWNDVSQRTFQDEIAPYFDALGDFQPSITVDVGAASGHFGIVASKIFPGCRIYAFEPALRQRILLSRNMRLNSVINCEVQPVGLWKTSGNLPFRTVGAESSFAPVSRFQGVLSFPETVAVVSLDRWVEQKGIARVDLIKIDAEGAEVEILEGAQSTLSRFHPRMLIQAYHLRNGTRTFEWCAQTLRSHGYDIEEQSPPSGLLYATFSEE